MGQPAQRSGGCRVPQSDGPVVAGRRDLLLVAAAAPHDVIHLHSAREFSKRYVSCAIRRSVTQWQRHTSPLCPCSTLRSGASNPRHKYTILSAHAVATTGTSNTATETPYRPSLCCSVERCCSCGDPAAKCASKTQQLPSQLPATAQPLLASV
jgi:hypothetical protein